MSLGDKTCNNDKQGQSKKSKLIALFKSNERLLCCTWIRICNDSYSIAGLLLMIIYMANIKAVTFLQCGGLYFETCLSSTECLTNLVV